MDKTTTWIIRGAAGAFILFVFNSLINTGKPTINIGESTKKIINKTPNSCPLGFAYAGTGYCRKVACVYRSGRNNPDLGGKDYACGNADFWASGMIGRLPLEWGSETIQATYDLNCPNKAPSIGWRSSCSEARGEPSNPYVVGGVRRK